MKTTTHLRFTAIFIFIGINLTGCTSTPVQIGKNTYTVDGIGRSMTFKDAVAHCQKQGLMMKPLSSRRPYPGYSDITLDYKCLNQSSPEYNRYVDSGASSVKVDKTISHR